MDDTVSLSHAFPHISVKLFQFCKMVARQQGFAG